MMKVTIQYPSLPEIVIESDPNGVADLLLKLSAQDFQPKGRAETPLAPSRQPKGDSAQPRVESVPQDAPVPAVPQVEKLTDQAPSDQTTMGARPYGGKPNRRAIVLGLFQELAKSGNPTPSLSDIKTCFASKFPDQGAEHLGQVIRDLANKTDLVDRVGRGSFQLTLSGLAQAPDLDSI